MLFKKPKLIHLTNLFLVVMLMFGLSSHTIDEAFGSEPTYQITNARWEGRTVAFNYDTASSRTFYCVLTGSSTETGGYTQRMSKSFNRQGQGSHVVDFTANIPADSTEWYKVEIYSGTSGIGKVVLPPTRFNSPDPVLPPVTPPPVQPPAPPTYIPTKLSSPTELSWDGYVARWNDVAEVEYFSLYLKQDEKVIFDDLISNDLSFDFRPLIKTKGTYTFGVKAIPKNTAYAPSEYAISMGAVLDVTSQTVAKPFKLKLKPARTVIKLTYNTVKGAESYKIYVRSGTKYKLIGVTEENTFHARKLKRNHRYVFIVKAVAERTKAITKAAVFTK